MKSNLIPVFLIFMALNFISCKKKEEKPSVQDDRLSVAVISSDKKVNLKISKAIDIGTLDFPEEVLTVTPEKEVSISVKTDKPILCFMLADNSPVIFYFQPGKTIHIRLEHQNTKTSVVLDDDDHVNSFTKEFHNILMPLMTDQSEKEVVLEKINKAESDMLQKLNVLKSKIDPVFYKVLEAMVTGKMDHIKFMQSERFKDLTMESPYFDFTDHYNFDNDYFLTYTDNLNTVIGVLETQHERKYSEPLEEAPDMIGFVSRSVKSRHLRDQTISFLLSRKIPQMNGSEKEELMEKLKEINLEDKYLNFLSTIEAGSAIGRRKGSPLKYLGSLKAYDKNFSEDQLKGKIVYIDNWATWCGPCIKSIKNFTKKQKAIEQSDDIVYVFVSFDRKESIWKNFIEKNTFGAKNVIHLYNGSDMNTDYAKYYNISGLPFYLVAGKDGKVKDLDPKEPMDDEYGSYINKLIR